MEALSAGVILALAGTVLGVGISQSIRSLGMARDLQRASELLDQTLTKIDTIGPARLALEGPTEGPFEPPHDRFAWKVRIRDLMEGYLYDVVVQIVWTTPGGKVRSVEVQTYLNDPPGSRPGTLQWEDL